MRQRRYGHKKPFSDLLYLQLISCPTACTTVLIFLYLIQIFPSTPCTIFVSLHHLVIELLTLENVSTVTSAPLHFVRGSKIGILHTKMMLNQF